MPQPITAAVVAKTMAKGAIAKVGGKILESVAPGVFSNSKDFHEIKEQLSEISKKLDEVLAIARTTFRLIEQLPNIVSEIVDEQTLYLAQTRIESSIQVYISLNTRPNAISHGELTDLVQSWNILVDKEKKTSVISRFPNYCEYLLSATDGKLYNSVLFGINNKQLAVESAHQSISNRILELAEEAEKIISGQYIDSGSILDSEPWLAWNPKGNRTRTEQSCDSMPCSQCNGGVTICTPVQVPDSAWNNELARLKNRIAQIRDEIGSLSDEYRSLIVTDEVLKIYKDSLIRRKDTILMPTSTLKVIESKQAFTTL